ncbi:hypothetical protein M413DRAFT_241268 [Hebeloma cylindrosporum]|uniref:Uncharacterized protein n=1 Tax=Hebeloma cylindrosporum TaxID=76867 RepID=A0A0C2YCK7_HEBCY|nr:hypothetical protein M413DRAFT_241268 [Hebeloma cylindrosporum h7]
MMNSNDIPPLLDLSDIMHHMSPSPVPAENSGATTPTPTTVQQNSIAIERAVSPERASETDVLGFRRRLEEMGLWGWRRPDGSQADANPDSSTSSRERELLKMVLRLTDHLSVDPTQLERQANTIAELRIQRDFIARQAEEERARWRSERESWDRTAEALLLQRHRPERSEDVDRLRNTYEAENKALRDKLQDAQRRLSMLEGDLMRLKPMLLMQPFSTSRTGSQRQDKGKGREVDTKTYLGTIPEGRELNDPTNRPYSYSHHPTSRPSINSPGPSSSRNVATPQSIPQRRPKDRPSKSHGKRSHHNMAPISSDAYTEHLLLAAKKIGRKRAAHVAGIVQHVEREKEVLAQEQEQIRAQKAQERLERERLERLASGTSGMAYYRPTTDLSHPSPQRGGAPRSAPLVQPKTPKRASIPYPIVQSPATPLVFVHQSGTTPGPSATHFPGVGVMGTPSQLGAALNLTSGRPGQSTPSTPFNSLLDAARSMLDESVASGSQPAPGRTNGKGRMLEEPESPVPKRRKVSATGKSGGALDRVKSALDVLADQAAAAVNEPDRSDRRPAVVGANVKGKGKAKETQEHEREGLDNGVPTSAAASTSGRGRSKARSSTDTTSRKRGNSASQIPPASTTSSRPARQSTRKRGGTPDSSAPPTSTRGGSGRVRGRSRGSNATQSRSSASGRVISPAPGGSAPRVISAAPGYSPLDEAMALSVPVQPSTEEQLERVRSEEHPQQAPLSLGDVRDSDPRLSLRPVAGWGQNGQSVSADSSSNSVHVRPTLNDNPTSQLSQEHVSTNGAPIVSEPKSGNQPPAHLTSEPEISRNFVHETRTILTNGHSHDQSSAIRTIPPPPDSNVAVPIPGDQSLLDIDAEAETDEDADAEGEQEEEEEEEEDGDSENRPRNPPSRSRSPPPPDPPLPGPDDRPPPDMDDEHDPDADAEGEMEFEENGELPSGSMSSASRKSVEMERTLSQFNSSHHFHTLPWFHSSDGTDAHTLNTDTICSPPPYWHPAGRPRSISSQDPDSSSPNDFDRGSFLPRRVLSDSINPSDHDSFLTVTCAKRKGIPASKFRARGWPRIHGFIRRNDVGFLRTCVHALRTINL